jgi:hypothetical protein
VKLPEGVEAVEMGDLFQIASGHQSLDARCVCLLHTSLKGNGYEDDEGLHCRAISGRDANGSRARADKSRCS